MFGKKRFHVAQHAISELLKRFPSTKGTLCVLGNFFTVFDRIRPGPVLKHLRLLSLRLSADFLLSSR